ncbi:MAG: response regulator, partial [bacterium]
MERVGGGSRARPPGSGRRRLRAPHAAAVPEASPNPIIGVVRAGHEDSALPTAAAEAGPRILVVDDDLAVHHFLAVALRRDGFDAVMASSGPSALEVVRSVLVDLIVCDLGLPGMSGLDVIRELRAAAATSAVPVIVMTGSVGSEALVEALDAGADDFVTKPVQLHELTARIRARLRSASAWSALATSQIRGRAEVTRAITRSPADVSPEHAARDIVQEIGDQMLPLYAAVYQVTSDGGLLPLAQFTRRDGTSPGGFPIVPARARSLLDQLRRGAWVRAVSGPELNEPATDVWGLGVELAGGGPIYAGEELVAAILLGFAAENSGLGLGLQRARLLAAISDMSALLSLRLGDALGAQRHLEEERQRIRAVASNHRFELAYQPIVSLESGSVQGHEALTRFADGARPDTRFAQAAAAGIGAELEMASLSA